MSLKVTHNITAWYERLKQVCYICTVEGGAGMELVSSDDYDGKYQIICYVNL